MLPPIYVLQHLPMFHAPIEQIHKMKFHVVPLLVKDAEGLLGVFFSKT